MIFEQKFSCFTGYCYLDPTTGRLRANRIVIGTLCLMSILVLNNFESILIADNFFEIEIRKYVLYVFIPPDMLKAFFF